jgi:hypothetical protein
MVLPSTGVRVARRGSSSGASIVSRRCFVHCGQRPRRGPIGSIETWVSSCCCGVGRTAEFVDELLDLGKFDHVGHVELRNSRDACPDVAGRLLHAGGAARGRLSRHSESFAEKRE